MAVQEQTPYIEYTANGTTTSFALKFDCDNQDHLIVLVDDVEPVVGAWSFSNGAVVFNTAPENGKKITIQRNTPFSRTTDYQSYNNSFRPPTVNKDFDWIWLKLQELGVADWILSNRIDALKNYVDDRDDELRAYLMEEIRKQGVALDQLDEYYNYLMQRLAQIAVDKGWDASFVVDGVLSQKEVNKVKGLNIWEFFTASEISSYNANPTTFDMTVALQRGIGAATLLNRKIEGYGEFYIANTLVISCACDLLDVQLNTDVTNKTAVQVRMSDYSYMWRKELKLPKVFYENHVAQDGWVDNAVGIEIINTLSCEIEVPHVRNFHTNLKVTSTLSTCYNNFYIGQLDNGKINLDVTTSPLTETAQPWTNENNFFGGRYSHNGGEGTNVPGVRHIRLYAETSTLNNNVFYKPSIEASVSEYNLELGCQYCRFIQSRFESDPPKVLYVKDNNLPIGAAMAEYNVIEGGYNSNRIVFSKQGTGVFLNTLISPNRELRRISSTSGGNRYQNVSGRTHAAISLFQPEVDIDTADFSQYSLMVSSGGLRGKRYTDTSDRLFINVYDGAIVFTDGAGSTPVSIARNAVGLNITGVLHSTTPGTDLGTNNYRFGRLLLSGGIGCYGSTPPATKPSITGKKTPATIAEQNAVMDSIVAALVAFGLASDDRTV